MSKKPAFKPYRQVYDQQWVLMPRTYRKPVACCDCGLVHLVTTKIEDGKVWMRVSRDEERTRDVRRVYRRRFAAKKVER